MEEISELKLYELYYLITAYMLHDDMNLPYSIDFVHQSVSNAYTKETGLANETNQDKVSNWLANKCRYQLLDELMLHMYHDLTVKDDESMIDNTDLFFVNNLYAMDKVMESYYDEVAPIIYNTESQKLSESNKKETISIVKDILSEIDDNNEWLNMYEDMLSINHIIYINELSDVEKDKLVARIGVKSIKEIENSCLSIDNDTYIFLNYTNTIADIPTTIHEVIHYIIKETNFGSRELPILREFPSIFFELYALNYLKRLGYDETEIRTINQARLTNSFSMYHDVKDMMYYLKMLIEKGRITEKQDLKTTNREINRIKKIFNKQEINALLADNPNEFDAKTKCYERADSVINNIIINPDILFNYYPYIIGSYLADMAIKRTTTSRTTLSLMKYISEKISKLDGYDIFSVLETQIPNLIPTDYTNTDKLNKSKVRSK